MSETSVLNLSDEDPDDGTGRDRRTLVALGAVAVAVALGGGWLLLGGSGADVPTSSSTVLPAAPGSRATTVAGPTASPAAPLPARFADDLGRNPFRALYVQPAGSGAGAGVGAGSGAVAPAASVPASVLAPVPAVPTAGTSAVGTAGRPTPAPAPVAAASPVAVVPAAPAVPTAREHRLVLRGVTGTGDALTATFLVDGRSTTARPGAAFGPIGEIRLVSVQQGPAPDQWTAVLQVGDGEPFDVVTGDAVSVR